MPSILIQKLRRLRFLSASSENLLKEIAAAGSLHRYHRGNVVYMQNDVPKSAHLILSGMANRETTQSGGVVIQHARALAGDWLGLANVTGRIVPYMHSAIAADTSEIVSFDIPRFSALRLIPEFSHYLLQIVGKEQLDEEERHLNNLSSARSYDKLILFLAAEMDRTQKRGVSALHSPYIIGTQKYFADAIGTSRETVTRDLQPLLNAGILERSRGVRPTRYTILKQRELSYLAASPLRRSALYEQARRAGPHRRFSDVA
ncbi:MAG: Crp/Fnr family transcriptional regulator [Acidobacteriota bacterium]|nr:Crp/Fnr family transcriptional regulator [Acidobacteriota bacterium]